MANTNKGSVLCLPISIKYRKKKEVQTEKNVCSSGWACLLHEAVEGNEVTMGPI